MTNPALIYPVNASALPHPMAERLRNGTPRHQEGAVADALRQSTLLHPDKIVLMRWKGVPDTDNLAEVHLRNPGPEGPDEDRELWETSTAVNLVLQAWDVCRIPFTLEDLLSGRWIGAISSNVCLFLSLDANVSVCDAPVLRRHLRVPDFSAATTRLAHWTQTPPGAVPLACAPVFTPFESRHDQIGWEGSFRAHAWHIIACLADRDRMRLA